jgi:pyridoxamine 5'-phosphate oxidase
VVVVPNEPWTLFERWFSEAKAAEPDVPDAMTIATVGADGFPRARTVLLKGWDERGFVFYTNQESGKGADLDQRPRAAGLFHWKSLQRQVLFDGAVSRTSEAESDAYFASRPYGSRIGAWASDQSRPLSDRKILEDRVDQLSRQWPEEVPRPPHWGGYRILPRRMEFWQGRPDRLHDRREYVAGPSGWTHRMLYP